jgi:hypothetical protein
MTVLAVSAALACTDITGMQGINSGTGGTVNLTGSWSYSMSNVESPPVTCSSSGTVLVITQNGTSFSGTYSGGTLTCGAGGSPQVLGIAPGSIAAGTRSGSNITFNLTNDGWRNAGTAGGNTMSGSVTLRLTVNSTPYTLNGTWVATKQ